MKLIAIIITIGCVAASATAITSDPNAMTKTVAAWKQTKASALRTDFEAMADSASPDKTAITKLIEELKGTAVRRPAKKSAPSIVQILEPNIAVVKEPNVVPPKQEIITEELASAIGKTAADANAVPEPVGVAESLYAAGRPKEAARFYEIALTRKTSMGQEITDDDRAWMLLQIATCRQDDPNSAVKALRDLIDRYPNSTWAAPAVAKRDLMLWYASAHPRDLVRKSK
jgi:hypothetical protein